MLTFFNYSRPNIKRSECKTCQSEYNKEYNKKRVYKSRAGSPVTKKYRDANKNKRNEYLKEWSKKNPEKRRAQKYRHRYGIGILDYNEILKTQGERCAICKASSPGERLKHFVVDHCHVSKEVRGLLCDNCNKGLGHFKDSANSMESAILYIKQNSYRHIKPC